MEDQDQTPKPDNNVFNHDAESLEKASGVNGDNIISRHKQILEDLLSNPGVYIINSKVAERVFHTFTHKELAILATKELVQMAQKEAARRALSDLFKE